MERRRSYESCYGPYRWVNNGPSGPTEADMAWCSREGCTRAHQDHVRKLKDDESLTDFCLICMKDH